MIPSTTKQIQVKQICSYNQGIANSPMNLLATPIAGSEISHTKQKFNFWAISRFIGK